jgi:choline kinase
MHAVLLAAGRGRRLDADHPKCLLDIGGKTLLERHLAAFTVAGVTSVTLVLGYEQQQIRTHLGRLTGPRPASIEIVENPDFVRGSIVSLQRASSVLTKAGGLFMDADVIYPPSLLAKLVTSKHESCVLVDPRSSETGEEMMVGIKADRVRAIARRVTPLGTWDVVGESVGFAKVGPAGAAVLDRILTSEVAAGNLDQEYEAAMNVAFGESVWGYEPVGEVAWTEIDFQEDVERAREIAAQLDASSAAAR